MLKPLADRIIIKRLEAEEKTASGIVLPDSAKEKPEQGEVIACGKDVKEVEKGDKVIFGKFSLTEVKVEGKEYSVIKEEDVLAIV